MKKAFIGKFRNQRNGRSLLYMHDLGLSLQRFAPYSIAVALCYAHKPRPLANSVRDAKTTRTYIGWEISAVSTKRVFRYLKESRILKFCCASSEYLLFRFCQNDHNV